MIPTQSSAVAPTEPIPAKSLVIKTDKPRPYVCTICTRSFARLEHLKRHERSHTKEKPFQCPVCERSFARRDLLLRHKQKLHNTSLSNKDIESVAKRKAQSSTSSLRQSPDFQERVQHNPSPPISMNSAHGDLGYQSHGHYNGPSLHTNPIVKNEFDTMPPTSPALSFPGMDSHNMHHQQQFNTNEVFHNQRVRDPTELRNEPVWLPLNPLEHELESMHSANTGGNQQRPDLRAHSFSATNGGTYLNKFDYESLFKDNSPEVGMTDDVEFATPQAYAPIFDRSPESVDPRSTKFRDIRTIDTTTINPQRLRSFSSTVGANGAWMPFGGIAKPSQITGRPRHNSISLTARNSATPASIPGADLTPFSVSSSIGSPMTVPAPNTIDVISPDFIAQSAPVGGMHHDPYVGARASVMQPKNPNGMLMAADPLFVEYVNRQSDDFMNSVLNLDEDQKPLSPTHKSRKHSTLSELGAPQQHNFDLYEQSSDCAIAASVDSTRNSDTKFAAATSFGLKGTPSTTNSGFSREKDSSFFNTVYYSSAKHLPSSQEVRKYVAAYYQDFGPHMQFIPKTTELNSRNMALVMSMAAIGALQLGELNVSSHIYDISRDCIQMYSDLNSNDSSRAYPLWLVQSTILAILYGMFHGKQSENVNAAQQITHLGDLLCAAKLNMPPEQELGPVDSSFTLKQRWRHFLECQKRIRTVYVAYGVSAASSSLFGFQCHISEDILKCGSPCDERLWMASSADDWWNVILKRNLQNNYNISYDYNHFAAQLVAGQPITEHVPQFTLASLIYSLHLEVTKRSHDTPAVLNILKAWESTWAQSPHASLDPASKHGPIMPDCVPMASLLGIRAWLDLRSVNESFWARDFVSMNQKLKELARSDPNAVIEASKYAIDCIVICEKHIERRTSMFFVTVLALLDAGLVLYQGLNIIETMVQQPTEKHQMILMQSHRTLTRIADSNTYPQLSVDHDMDKTLGHLALSVVSALIKHNFSWPSAGIMLEALAACMYS